MAAWPRSVAQAPSRSSATCAAPCVAHQVALSAAAVHRRIKAVFSHLFSTALAAFSLLFLSLSASISCTEHHHWEPLLPPRAPLCHHRLGVRSPSRPPFRADRTPPLTPFPSDQAAPPTTKDLHDVNPRRSSSGLISAVLSSARRPDSFPTQQPAPNDRRLPPPHCSPPADCTLP
jgi:hypothetical protein